MKKIFIVLLLVVLQISSFPVVLAQEATESAREATPSASQDSSSEATTSAEILDSLDNTESLTATPSAFDITEPLPSAQLKLSPAVRKLTKKNYKAGEKLTVVIDNVQASDYQISLFGPDGRRADVTLEEVNDSYPAIFRITPPAQFKAGRYRLVVKDKDGGTASTQEFTWGVLAINTNKSIYLPNETAILAMAVLDETGLMVCDARLRLEIKAPDGQAKILSTEDETITVNPECQLKEYVEKADYEATYQAGEAGGYEMTLTAETKNGTYSINDSFEVRNEVPFDIERVIATRLYPPVTYPAVFNILANEDFAGVVKEVVPADFAISQLEGVKAYDAIEDISEASSSTKPLEASIFNLVPPFDTAHPITTRFGQELNDPILQVKYSQYGLLGHDGVDFAMEEGTPVLSVDEGVVVKAQQNWDYGTTIVIQHSWGKSYYGHLSLMTKKEGDKVQKGYPIGLSGSTGLSTGPHLHFGIKPNSNDPDNGYYGKIDPLPYLALKEGNQDVLGESSQNPIIQLPASSSSTLRVISWNLSLKKGETVKLGYNFQVPNISPQFYLIGPLKFERSDGNLAFQEARSWQLAVDADGSGTNTVSPTTGSPSATGQTYTFTFTASEAMNSGGFTIAEPTADDWTVPQGTAGSAGYTTATGNGSAIVATVEDVMDSATGWAAGTLCSGVGGLSADTSVKQEGAASIKCVQGDEASGDVFYKNITSEDWSSYTRVGMWLRSTNTFSAAQNRFQFIYDNTTNCASELETLALAITTANTWEYNILTFGATTRTAVICYGFQINHGSQMDSTTQNIDYLLLGPGTPTFSGTSPWVINVPLLTNAASDTVSVVYGSGGGSSGVTNSATAATHTFTTQSRTSITGTLTNISSSPTVTLSSGPTNDQLMRHGAWFDAGVEQPFTF